MKKVVIINTRVEMSLKKELQKFLFRREEAMKEDDRKLAKLFK